MEVPDPGETATLTQACRDARGRRAVTRARFNNDRPSREDSDGRPSLSRPNGQSPGRPRNYAVGSWNHQRSRHLMPSRSQGCRHAPVSDVVADCEDVVGEDRSHHATIIAAQLLHLVIHFPPEFAVEFRAGKRQELVEARVGPVGLVPRGHPPHRSAKTPSPR